jgi:hypothetical protein
MMIIPAQGQQEGGSDGYVAMQMYRDIERCPCGKHSMRNVVCFEIKPVLLLADGSLLFRPPVYYTEMGCN